MGKKRPASGSAIPATEKRQKLSREEDGPAGTRCVLQLHPRDVILTSRSSLFRETLSTYAEGKSEEQEDFPRGGRGALSALEKRVIREKAMRGVLFNEVDCTARNGRGYFVMGVAVSVCTYVCCKDRIFAVFVVENRPQNIFYSVKSMY